MDDNKKMINWVAGISTMIVALLIAIVVLEPRNDWISRAVAARTVALTLADQAAVREAAAEGSAFPEEMQGQWYVRYMDYLYRMGALDEEACPPGQESALAAVTYGDLSLSLIHI